MMKVALLFVYIILLCRCKQGLECPFRKVQGRNTYSNRYWKASTRNSLVPWRVDKDQTVLQNSICLRLKTVFVFRISKTLSLRVVLKDVTTFGQRLDRLDRVVNFVWTVLTPSLTNQIKINLSVCSDHDTVICHVRNNSGNRSVSNKSVFYF